LGGRAAEQIFFGKISTGAQNDLERITKLAYSMITMYGMSEKVGQVSFYDPQGEYGYQRPYSEVTAQMIDEEVRRLINEAYARTIALLTEKKNEVETVAKELLEKEIIFKADIERLIGQRPYDPVVIEEPETLAVEASAETNDEEPAETTLVAESTEESASESTDSTISEDEDLSPTAEA